MKKGVGEIEIGRKVERESKGERESVIRERKREEEERKRRRERERETERERNRRRETGEKE